MPSRSQHSGNVRSISRSPSPIQHSGNVRSISRSPFPSQHSGNVRSISRSPVAEPSTAAGSASKRKSTSESSDGNIRNISKYFKTIEN